MLQAGAEPLVSAIRKGAEKYRRTGGLAESVGVGKIKKTKGVYEIAVVFQGRDKAGHPNVVKAMALEFGTSRQPATPFIREAVRQIEAQVAREMERALLQNAPHGM